MDEFARQGLQQLEEDDRRGVVAYWRFLLVRQSFFRLPFYFRLAVTCVAITGLSSPVLLTVPYDCLPLALPLFLFWGFTLSWAICDRRRVPRSAWPRLLRLLLWSSLR